MFTNPLPDDGDYRVIVSKYAQRHFAKRFAKDYRGKRWEVTERSIIEELKRVHAIQGTTKVDELKRGSGCVLFKYDFTVAQSGVSPKASGNRCIIFLDIETHLQTIIIMYNKNDLPKNQHETAWCLKTFSTEFMEFAERLD